MNTKKKYCCTIKTRTHKHLNTILKTFRKKIFAIWDFKTKFLLVRSKFN